MCGVAGIVSTVGEVNPDLMTTMRDVMQHRGPDDAGIWTAQNVALAHRRLAIVDLSPAGHQPMCSADGAWVLSYNGEIYNATAIRAELNHIDWRGSSDTEVLIEAIAHWGVEKAVQRIVGMFAFAVFDTKTRSLWLCRDRLGIKPLYYGWADGCFVFASELRAIKAIAPQLPLNVDAISSFLRYSYIPAPASIFADVHKLQPGQLLHLNTDNIGPGTTPRIQNYWNIQEYAENTQTIGESEAEDRLLTLLRTAVSDRMVADVPLGAFLSGGFDSSLVCALMAEQASEPVRTFTIGFDDPRFNEAEHAKAIAQHLGTRHTELYLGETDMLDAVAELGKLNDEPFADPSILPTFLVSQMAKRDVTVALSGDGGDELFWGYTRYQTAERIWNTIKPIPAPLRRLAARTMKHPLTQGISRHLGSPSWGGRRGRLDQKLAAASDLVGSHSQASLYHGLVSHWKDPAQICLQGRDLITPFNDPGHWTNDMPARARMAMQDTLTYLPDDILTKVDRASMNVSLEARVPLLDHRLVEFICQLPSDLRYKPGQPKYLLKKVLNRYVPAKLTDRPKMGFGVPLDVWLRGPLKTWAHDLLSPDRLRGQNLLDPEPITDLLQQHMQGRANNAAKLWDVLMLQAWL
jgi:asparagine synthase (glutamine-hydrolysing)